MNQDKRDQIMEALPSQWTRKDFSTPMIKSERPERLHQFFEARCDAMPDALALICGPEHLRYRDLDTRANRLAHHLLTRGVGPGQALGILLQRSLDTYVALLAVLKTGAAFVPIDTSFPEERVRFIAGDAALSMVITTGEFREVITDIACPAIELDRLGAVLAALPDSRPAMAGDGDDLCYIMYTSGSTGRPKGIAISQASICNFLSVVTPIYGVTATDRVYQGMTIAFDFSIEEIWPTWIAGATLIAGPSDLHRLGPPLTDFLVEHEVTVLCCVPTLLATLERDVPSLRTLILGGEPCPRDLVQRWSRPGRRILNTYGPTETTVTATWSELKPDQPVTIGRPLPSYSVYLLDEHLRPVANGEIGEICIGGIGVARGYVNRPSDTGDRFVADPFAGARPGARLYRTGDLGRLAPSGQIEYLGRADGQVKIRGYRIELSEIEAVLLEDEAVKNAIVSTSSLGDVVQELVAYVTLWDPGAIDVKLSERLHGMLRRRLPDYMVPSFIEVIDTIPMLANGKADRSSLPPPTTTRLGARSVPNVPPATPLEKELAALWGKVFGRSNISVEADFFLDLGGHSLFAALVVSALRRNAAHQSLGIADLYAHPTIRSLARHIESARADPTHAASAEHAPLRRHTSARVWRCGLAQLAGLYVASILLFAPVAWLFAQSVKQPSLARLVAIVAGVPVMLIILSLALPILARPLTWKLRPGRYPLWGVHYFRWWLARWLLGLAPLSLLVGSPLMTLYLRLLGARIGEGCHIGTPRIGLPNFLTVEDRVSIGYGAELQPFVVEDGWLTLAPIHIGADAFVGTNAVVMAGASVGSGSRLAEQSLAAHGQRIPDGTCWAGSPAAQVANADQLLDAMAQEKNPTPGWSAAHLTGFVAGVLALELLPLIAGIPGLLVVAWGARKGGVAGGSVASLIAGPLFVLTVCALVAIGKRLVLPAVQPGIYPLRSSFGLRKWFADTLMVQSLAFSNTLYGTLYALSWLRLLGAKVGRRSEVSTVAHIDPDLLVLGPESFVADFASVGAAIHYNGFVALGPTKLGRRCFVGNAALVRSHSQLGDNSLIGVQSVPPSRSVEPGTSWLGSPAIFLPRRQPSEGFGDDVTYHPRATLVACRLAIEFLRVTGPAILFYLSLVLFSLAELRLAAALPLRVLVGLTPVLVLAGAVGVTLAVALLKWLVIGCYRLRVEPLWNHFVWRSELVTGLYESVAVPALIDWLTGTPWIGPALRLFGARIGRRVWLGTTYITEFDLVHVGDDVAVGSHSSLQTHLFEDRVMKMSTVTVGPDCSVGPRAVILYDSELGAGASLDALSLVMKGEALPAGSHWRGIPGRAVA